MKREIYLGLAVLLLGSSCSMVRQGESDSKKSVGSRIERAGKFLTKTALTVTDDMLPLVTATTKELADEMKSDVPKVAGELSRQMSHLTSLRRSSKPGTAVTEPSP